MSETGYRTGPAHRGPSAIRLVWVYPDLLSTYGDRGNLLVLARRTRLRGFGVEIAEVNSDQRVPMDGDIYLLGGGEDLPQILAARRLAAGGGRAAAPAPRAGGFAVWARDPIVRTPGLAEMLLGWVAGTLPPVDPGQEDLVQQLRAERLAAQGAPA